MKILYSNTKTEKICTNYEEARRFFGGKAILADCLMKKIYFLENTDFLKDVIDTRSLRFHNLQAKGKKNLNGYFAIDVKTRKEPWRIILQPLDDNLNPFNPCNIDVIACAVRIVEIEEISNHYE